MMSEPTKSSKKKIFAKLGREKCIELMKRLEGGLSQYALAKELGVSRQYVSVEYKKYKERGEELYRNRALSMPTPYMNEEQLTFFRDMLRTGKTPAGELWEPDFARDLLEKEFGYRPRIGEIRKYMTDWRVWSKDGDDGDVFPQDYYEYIQSPVHQEIKKREQAMAEKWKREEERDQLERQKKAVAAAKNKPDAAELAEYDEELDKDMTPEDYKKAVASMRKQVALNRAGGRLKGKRSKGSHRQKPKKKRRKK
ncbi:MAG: helix-turn-helix domain-containing protein [Verrucomicrobiales bacterium]|nr:helix-turn-helix domain-containing protein [Verrucomicrobiales bacterium]